MSVILKKDEKVESIVSLLKEDYTKEDFIEQFIETYPEDWKKINANYNKHVRKNKPGKSIPMPEPVQYLKNALNVWLKNNN